MNNITEELFTNCPKFSQQKIGSQKLLSFSAKMSVKKLLSFTAKKWRCNTIKSGSVSAHNENNVLGPLYKLMTSLVNDLLKFQTTGF